MNHTIKITLSILLITGSQQLIQTAGEEEMSTNHEAAGGKPVIHESAGAPIGEIARESTTTETTAAKSASKNSGTNTSTKQSSQSESAAQGFDLTSKTHAEPTQTHVENDTGGLDFSDLHAKAPEVTAETASEKELNAKVTSEVQGEFESAGNDPAKISKAVNDSVNLVAANHPEATPDEIAAAKTEAAKKNNEIKKTGNWMSDFIKSINDFFKDWSESSKKIAAKKNRMRKEQNIF